MEALSVGQSVRIVSRALAHARDLDFDSTERLMEEARLVRENSAVVQQADEEIVSIRTRHAQSLEAQAVAAMDNGDFSRAERLLVDLVALGDADILLGQLRRKPVAQIALQIEAAAVHKVIVCGIDAVEVDDGQPAPVRPL